MQGGREWYIKSVGGTLRVWVMQGGCGGCGDGVGVAERVQVGHEGCG
jgi:hypothetical protein